MPDMSIVETIFKTNPFAHEGFARPLQLSELRAFLLNQNPNRLHPAQQRALIPIAAETSIRAVEEAIAKQYPTGPESLKNKIGQELAEALAGKRDISITQEQFEQAVTKVRTLDPNKNKRELDHLGKLSDKYQGIMRSKDLWTNLEAVKPLAPK